MAKFKKGDLVTCARGKWGNEDPKAKFKVVGLLKKGRVVMVEALEKKCIRAGPPNSFLKATKRKGNQR